MNNKFITSCMVLLIIFSSFLYVGTEIVSATEDNGTGLWFQAPGNHPTYNHNFTSTASDTTITQNDMALRVMVASISANEHNNYIHVWVSAVGACQSNLFTYTDQYEVSHQVYDTTKEIQISADISIDAPETTHLDVMQSHNSISLDVIDGPNGGTKTEMHLRNTTYFATESLIGSIPYISTGYNIAKFAYEEFGPGGSTEYKNAAIGPGDKVWQTFYRFDNYAGGLSSSDDIYTAGTRFQYEIPKNDIPTDFHIRISAKNIMGSYVDTILINKEDGAESHVDITIKNGEPSIISELSTDKAHYKTSDYGKGFVRPIFQNLMITNTAGSMDAKYFVTIEYNADWTNDWKTLTGDNDWITINQEFQKAFAINVPDGVKDQIVDIRYTVIAFDEYGGWVEGPYYIPSITVTDDLDTVLSVEAPADATTENSYGDHTYLFTVENAGDTDGSVSLTVDDTAGWPVSVEPSSFYLYAGETQPVDVTVTIPDGVADGGYSDIKLTATASPISGGGCPYVSSWNGTDYQLDNNILIASEHQDGMVDDHYVLQNVEEPKDGYYSLKIEEFENSKDHFDTVKLYTIDHQEGYEIATTPDGEIIAYREPRPAVSAYNSEGEDVLEYLNNTDGEALFVEEGSSVFLNFGELSKSQWEHNKLVVQSHGFESYTDVPPDDSDPGYVPPIKTSLHVGVRMDGSEWKNVTILHPRNHPSAIVIPLNETLEGFVENISGGSVTTPEEGTQTYDYGTVVDLVATPDTNYHFVEWSGDIDTIADVTSATTTINVTGNYSITANFAIDEHNLTIDSADGGSVTTPEEGTQTYDHGTVVDLVATPDTGYHFVNWTGDTDTIDDINSATTTLTMNDDYEITAVFSEDVAIAEPGFGSNSWWIIAMIVAGVAIAIVFVMKGKQGSSVEEKTSDDTITEDVSDEGPDNNYDQEDIDT